MEEGRLIVFEGIDRCGKTTQIDLLAKYLSDCGKKCHVMSFPNRTTDFGKLIVDLMNRNANRLSVHFLFLAHFMDSMDEIDYHLLRGKYVLCDRYFASLYSYSKARGVNEEYLYLYNDFILPHLMIYIIADPQECSKRVGYGVDDDENILFQQKVKKFYETGECCIGRDELVCDGSLSINDIHKQIVNKVCNL